MRAIDLADMLEEQYKNQHVQCNMTIATCGNRPCDLCRIEQFEREIRADERVKVLEEIKFEKLVFDFTLAECKKKDGRYFLDVTDKFNSIIDYLESH